MSSRNKFNKSAMRKSVYRNTSFMAALATGLAQFGIALVSPVGELLGTNTNPTKVKERHSPNGGRNRHPTRKAKHTSRVKSAKRTRATVRRRSHVA